MMATLRQYLIGAIAHALLLFVNFCVILGMMMSAQLLVTSYQSLPFLNALLLGYMIAHTGILVTIQLGVQATEFLKRQMPILLITYYFGFSDQESIPEPLLDPIKSKLAVIIILLIISGGLVLYPIFAIVGFLLLAVRIPIIVLRPPAIIEYFINFLNLVPPLLILVGVVIVLSIIAIEFKRQ
jgi:hypothetical protein